MMPDKFVAYDEIRVISPARSLSVVSQDIIDASLKRFNDLGLKISFSVHAADTDSLHSSTIESRIADIHEAFSDPNVKGIFTTIGGFNSNQLLRYLDYGLIRSNPKILSGYSDITALQNSIYAKTGLVTYSGPFFSTFGMSKGLDYTIEYFRRCLMQSSPYKVLPSKEWSDDSWYRNQNRRTFIKNTDFNRINYGIAEGVLVGGNLCTLNLLQGTEFMPDLDDTILFIEDGKDSNPEVFDRDLQSLIQQKGFEGVRGIMIGRFLRASGISDAVLAEIIKSKKELAHIPIISGLDFGHTTPQLTIPIGGRALLEVDMYKADLTFTMH